MRRTTYILISEHEPGAKIEHYRPSNKLLIKVPFLISFSVAEIVIYMQGLLLTAPCRVVSGNWFLEGYSPQWYMIKTSPLMKIDLHMVF